MAAKKLFFRFVLIILTSLALKQKFFRILFVLTRLVRQFTGYIFFFRPCVDLFLLLELTLRRELL